MGHGPTQAQFKVKSCKRLSLLQTSIKSMCNAANNRRGPQYFQERIAALAHMHDHWQAQLPRQMHLLRIKPFLPGAGRRRGERGDEKIQPNLAHRHQLRVTLPLLQLGPQRGDVALLRLRGKQRVNAQRVAVPRGVRQIAHRLPVAALYRHQHAMRYPGSPRCGPHGQAVGGERGRVQVAVGVDPGKGHGALQSSSAASRASTAATSCCTWATPKARAYSSALCPFTYRRSTGRVNTPYWAQAAGVAWQST